MILSLKLSDNITCIFLTCCISLGKVGLKSRTETMWVIPRKSVTAGSWAVWRSQRYNLGIMRSGRRIGLTVVGRSWSMGLALFVVEISWWREAGCESWGWGWRLRGGGMKEEEREGVYRVTPPGSSYTWGFLKPY